MKRGEGGMECSEGKWSAAKGIEAPRRGMERGEGLTRCVGVIFCSD